MDQNQTLNVVFIGLVQGLRRQRIIIIELVHCRRNILDRFMCCDEFVYRSYSAYFTVVSELCKFITG